MKKFLIVPALVACIASPAWAEKISLNALSKYLNGFQTAQGEFTQINGDGTISTGTIYIKRPGRVRFEYNPPDNSLVIAGGGKIAIFDPKSNVPPDQFPLRRTPLNLILKKSVNLAQAKMVTGHSSDGKSTTVVAQDPEHPEYGNIQLVFTAKPTELRQWLITDDSGTQTTVILGELKKGGTLSSFLFNIPNEIEQRTK